MIGEYTSKLKKGKLNTLINLFVDNKFFDFENSYKTMFKDLPTTYVYFSNKGESKKIMDYDGAPDDLKIIEKKIAELIKNLEWKKK